MNEYYSNSPTKKYRTGHNLWTMCLFVWCLYLMCVCVCLANLNKKSTDDVCVIFTFGFDSAKRKWKWNWREIMYTKINHLVIISLVINLNVENIAVAIASQSTTTEIKTNCDRFTIQIFFSRSLLFKWSSVKVIWEKKLKIIILNNNYKRTTVILLMMTTMQAEIQFNWWYNVFFSRHHFHWPKKTTTTKKIIMFINTFSIECDCVPSLASLSSTTFDGQLHSMDNYIRSIIITIRK